MVLPEEAGHGVVTANQTAEGYIRSMEGSMNGEVMRVWGGLEAEPRI